MEPDDTTSLDETETPALPEEPADSALDPAHLAALEATHGDLKIIELDGREFVFRRPSLAEFDRFQGTIDQAPNKRPEALRQLARVCLCPTATGGKVDDERKAFTDFASVAPYAAHLIGEGVLEMALVSRAMVAKKAPRSSGGRGKTRS